MEPLSRFARLAAHGTATSYAFVATAAGNVGWFGLDDLPGTLAAFKQAFEPPDAWEDEVQATLALGRRLPGSSHGLGFLAHLGVRPEQGGVAAYVVVADRVKRPPLSEDQATAFLDVAALLGAALEQDRRHAELVAVTERAARAEGMLQQVAEAASCEEALTRLLSELCTYHGASVGRIWRLTADEEMHEVSRFAAVQEDHETYYQVPTKLVRLGNSQTAESIHQNMPTAVIYSQIENQDQYALLRGAVAAGLRSQVSYPIWVQEQRFGVAMAFDTERRDLDAIVADIASLSNTIRPALFRKVTEERIWFMAHHDDLTKLGNRSVFNERLAEVVVAARNGQEGLALLYLDLDGFKLVNDTRGHEVGDKLLAAVAGRLRASLREGDVVARIGGDEFAIIHRSAGQPYAATQLARRLLTTVGHPFDIDGQPTVVSMSIGIALYPGDGETPDVLQRNADAALYEAKQRGRNTFKLFEPHLAVLQQERLLIERDLREAIEREDFTLSYQPIVEAEGLAVRGLEALLRWTHRTRGPLSPAKFVALAEASGLILPLGAWALDAACRAAAEWVQPLCLSVNLSPLQFRQAGLTQQIEAVLSRTGLPPARLDLEVTEGLLLDESGVVIRTMHELREMGVGMTLDDFGTGYASLSYLRRFPFDRIKIDRSFISGIGRDNATTAIVGAILSLSAQLRLAVVAEGVETEMELEQLRTMGCGLVQGFYTGRPVAGAEAAALVGGARGRVVGHAG